MTAAVPSPAAPLALFSPWYAYRDAGSAPAGNYRYRGTWESIDHLLLGPGLFDGVGVSYAGSDRFAVISDGLLDAPGGPPLFSGAPRPATARIICRCAWNWISIKVTSSSPLRRSPRYRFVAVPTSTTLVGVRCPLDPTVARNGTGAPTEHRCLRSEQ